MKFNYFLFFIVPLIACSVNEDTIEDEPLPKLYNSGFKELKNKNYKTALKHFKAIERQYPYSDWTIQAQKIIGFTQYLMSDYDESIESFKGFLQLHPHHKDVPYALYMIGISYMSQLSHIQRDQSAAHDAYQYFQEIIERFPNSLYTEEAKTKSQMVLDHLAAKEMTIARYYQKELLHHSALSRLDVIKKNFEKSSHMPEAYYRMIESYIALSLNVQAKKALLLLIKKFPDSKWAQYAKEDFKSLN